MAGFVFGGIAACRRTTHCLGLLRSSYRPLSLHPSLAPLHQRRRRHSSSSRSGGSGERQSPYEVKDQTKEPGHSAGGLETTAAPPDRPKAPGEQRPESPNEVRPKVLPIQDQPHRSQPSPAEVKPPNPHTIVCSSDNQDLSGSPDNVFGKNESFEDKVVELGSPVKITETKDFETKSESQIFPTSTVIDLIESPKYHSLSAAESKDDPKFENLLAIESELKSLTASISEIIEQPNQQTFSPIKAELKSVDSPTTNKNSQGVTRSPELLSQRSSFVTPFEIKSKDSNPSKSKDRIQSKESQPSTKSNPRPASKSSDLGGSLDLKVMTSPLAKPQTEKASAQTESLKGSSEPKNSKTRTCEGATSTTFNMPGENKISGIKVDLETLKDRSEEFGQLLDKVQEKRFGKVDAVKEKPANRDVIQKWVEHFKLAGKKAASANETKTSGAISAPSERNNERKVYFIETLVKENNIWVPKNSRSSNTISHPSGKNITAIEPTKSPRLPLPLKIVPENEAPTAFKKTVKPVPSSELKSNKNTQFDVASKATKPTEFILGQPPLTKNSSSVDSKNSNAVLNATSNKSSVIDQDKRKGQTTEEIVAMFKEDNESDQAKIEEGRVRELFNTLERFNDGPGSCKTLSELSSATKNNQSDVLAMLSSRSDKKGGGTINEKGHLDSTDSGNKTEDTFTKLGDLDSTIREEEYVDAQRTKDKHNEDYFAKLSNLDSTIRDESSDKQNKQGESKESENKNEKNDEQKKFDLAQKVSSFMKSAQKPQRFEKMDSKTKSKVETTSELTPSDLYDPIAPEVSSPAPVESGKADLEDIEEPSPSLEAPEVKPKKEEAKVKAPTAMDETKTKVDEKPPLEQSQPKKEKPQLDDGELALKLLDKATGEIPATAQPTLKPQAEKSFFQHLFDKILGRGKSNEGKRQMSSYTGRRHLSTSSMEESPVVICLQQPVLEPPTLELFAKNDDTEIKGGSPECSSPKKSPRELLREKQQTRKIKILGGSEECAKKMKRLKELTKEKDDDDDCGSRHFSNSVSRFCRHLWFSIIPEAANNSNKVK
ncbi:cylicin-1 [Drosophila suzukii]|uniref:Cylicin-1 n=1 Tax=Drosophila suzukii TaxID=28584 RepID=A0ABM4TSF8_DROSZ